ncbi:sigma-70 family RNA polymerase sigma factor [Streptomyces sp. SKN60]|uniref:sigma-70 family RNA polymerase sigma factor n=1 Tax=Streptomyces sp. SKN60 TaxID=2855506 RepID=UPI002247E11D|nr:sigma-70 family RNA polymerase sigma factor [Streptomyces sp. SKN60]MCX2185739.1 sigma-70 family RNA polymerase sigma factor [Streptomyces sp. SKN60]
MRATDDGAALTERFEQDRPHLRAVAYRMLGSLAEADDALQEAWLRANDAGVAGVENLGGWLTTVVSRVCLNMLRSRDRRREDPLDARPGAPGGGRSGYDPEEEAVTADSVGVALLVVLDTLAPAERLAFVLHDLFAVPFDDIAPLLERTPTAVRQLASRARRRVRGGTAAAAAGPDLLRRRRVVEAFLAATRGGDLEALVALLHPDVVLHADRLVVPTPEPIVVSGGRTVAQGALAAMGRARFTGLALVDGAFALAMAPQGRLRLVLTFAVADDGLITGIEIVAEPDRLAAMELTVPA